MRFYSRLWLVLMLFTLVPSAGAVYLNSLVYDMRPDEQFISLPVVNDTPRTNLYTVHAYEIGKPTVDASSRVEGAEMQVVYSPLKFTVAPGGKDFFKLYYRGPEDRVERYYRVIVRESPVKLFPFRDNEKHSDVISVLSMSTFLIVRPRMHTLSFELDERAGTLHNTGNTFFRVIIHKGCNGDDDSSTQFYMLPGEKYSSSIVSKNNKKFIVAMGRYTLLGEGCFTA